MSEIQPATQMTQNVSQSRQVWVVSLLQVPKGHSPLDYVYREEYKGKPIEIPPGGEKKVKMAWIHATKFLSQVNGMHDPNPDGSYTDMYGRVDSKKFGKPLAILEMTEEERKSAGGLTQEQIDQAKAIEEAELKNANHNVSGSGVPLGTEFPQARSRGGRFASKANDKLAEAELAKSL